MMTISKRGRKMDWESYNQVLVRREEVSCLYISVDTMLNDHPQRTCMHELWQAWVADRSRALTP